MSSAAPLAYEPFSTLAMIYEDEGDTDKSLQFSLIAAHLNPSDCEEWIRLAEMSLEQNNIRQAIICYSKGERKRHPRHILTKINTHLVPSERDITDMVRNLRGPKKKGCYGDKTNRKNAARMGKRWACSSNSASTESQLNPVGRSDVFSECLENLSYTKKKDFSRRPQPYKSEGSLPALKAFNGAFQVLNVYDLLFFCSHQIRPHQRALPVGALQPPHALGRAQAVHGRLPEDPVAASS